MGKVSKFWPLLATTIAITGFAIAAAAQLPSDTFVGSVPVGLSPLGIDITNINSPVSLENRAQEFAVVANWRSGFYPRKHVLSQN